MRILILLMFLPIAICAGGKEDSAGYLQYDNLFIRHIAIKGLRFTRRHVAVRELYFREGERFSAEGMEAGLRALEKLDIFAEVGASLQPFGDSVDITLNFKEVPLLVPHPTGEYTEENGLSLGAGFISTNMWGRNHYAEGSFKTGLVSDGVDRFSLEYQFPRFLDQRLRTSLWAASENRENKLEGFQEKYRIGRIQMFNTLLYRQTYQVQAAGEVSLETMGASRDSILLSHPVCPCADAQDVLPGAGFFIIFDSRNFLGNPSRGFYAEQTAYAYGGGLRGDGGFFQFTTDLRWYHHLTSRQHLVFSQLVTLQTGETGRDIPIYRHFWIGGANTVRGHELGEIRGKNQTLSTVEYRFLLLPPRPIPLFLFGWYLDIGLQPFLGLDAGTVWNETLGEQDWLRGAAAGIHVLVPYIQMARFSLGLSEKLDRIQAEFHLSPFDKPTAQRFRRR